MSGIVKIIKNINEPIPKYLIIFIFYVFISLIFFGAPVLKHISEYYIGGGIDPAQYIWSFEWVKYSVLRLKNPLISPFMWTPYGYNLTGSTFVLGAALLFIPVTLIIGPVASYNIAMILLPALAAFSMFILIKHIVKRIMPSIVSGYIFGFSTYMVNQMSSHMHLVLVFLIPLFIYLSILKIENNISPKKFVILFAAMLIFQFMFSMEIFATFTLFGFISFLLFYFINPQNLKNKIFKVLKYIGVSYLLALIILSPYLYYYFIQGRFDVVNFAPADFSSNLLNFFIPSRYNLIGGKFFNFISKTFDTHGWIFDQDAYIGLPLIFLTAFYFYKEFHKPLVKALAYLLLIVAVFSMGPTLHIYKYSVMPMPYKPFVVLPLIRHALPARFMLYGFVILAIIVSFFLKNDFNSKFKINAGLKYLVVLFGIAFLIPSFSYKGRYTKPNVPVFFKHANYEKIIKKGKNVLIIPYGYNGLTDYYQAIDGLYYKTASGYLGATPSYVSGYAIVHTLYTAEPIPFAKKELFYFLSKNNIKEVILIPPVKNYYLNLFGNLKTKSLLYKYKGVYIYNVPESVNKYENINIKITKPILKEYYFNTILRGVKMFVEQNHNYKNISPETLEKFGYIPKFFGKTDKSGNFKKYFTNEDSWVGPFYKDMGIGIGIGGSYKNLELIIKKYKKYAKEVFFPYPLVYNNSKRGNGLLLLIFDKAALNAIPENLYSKHLK